MPPELPRSKRQDDFPTMTIEVDGDRYELRLGEVSSAIAKEVRREAGRSLSKVISEAQDDADIDTIAVLVFAARRQRGEKVTLAEVEAAISYQSDFGLEAGEVAEDPGEVPAAS